VGQGKPMQMEWGGMEKQHKQEKIKSALNIKSKPEQPINLVYMTLCLVFESILTHM